MKSKTVRSIFMKAAATRYCCTISGDDLVVEFWGMESHYRRGNPGDSATETPDGGSPTTYYTVTFNSMGGSKVASVQVAAGTKIAAPATPTKDRYNFSGWYKDAGRTTAWDFSTDVVNGDITLYANWVGEDGKILAVANATISDYNIFMQIRRDVDYVSLTNAVTIGGSGTWRLYRDILGSQEIPTKIAAGSNGKLSDGNNIFYIVSTSSDGQQVRTYTLTVHRSYAVSVTVIDPYGNPSYYNSFYTYFDRVNIDKNFPGYTVNGWTCSDPEWGTKGYITDSATFTPSCTPNTYTVTLDAEGGTISSGGDTKSVTYDSGYSLPVPSKTGYSFLGWYCQGSRKTDSYGSSLSDWNYTDDTTFYAQWEINEYYLNARSSDTDAGTVTGGGYYDYLEGATITAITNPGYTFIGWYEGGTKLTGELTYSFTMTTENKTYTAKWVKVNIVSEDTAKGTVTPLTGTYMPGDRDTITAITNPGYTFIGWYEGETKLTGELSYTFEMPAEDKTYTARWKPTQYSVNLIVSGDTVWNTETAGIGSALSVPDTEEGLTFVCWQDINEVRYTNNTGTVFKAMSDGLTLYAKFVSTAYTISTAEELQSITLDGTYYLLNDIDLGGAEWTPIGTDSKPFTGTIYGNGYTVSNFKITTGREYVGLFGYNEGVIQNLGVEDFTVNVSYSGDVYAGGLVGYSHSGSITNCYATGEVNATGSSSARAGGLVGSNSGGNITNCYATGEVSATSTSSSSSACAGGLAGDNDGGSITNCYATGKVSATDSSSACAGGLAGRNSGGSITNCYATGNVSATSTSSSAYAGGLVGHNYSGGSITNCYATGNVSATSTSSSAYAGGLVGYNSGNITNCYATGNVGATSTSTSSYYTYPAYAGGLVGENSGGSIKNCYATGDVSATYTSSSAYAGGLVGYNYFGSITNCYATGNVRATGSSSSDAYAGGLAGYNDGGSITNCYATGEVSATSSYEDAYAGGLAGYNDGGSIKNCYATGDVSASSSSYYVYDDAYAGGLVGVNSNSGSIKNCYATGEVSATSSSSSAYAGGLVGYNPGGSITNCYRYIGQTFYRKQDLNIYSSASNNEGTAKDLATLQSVAFHTSTLGWEASVWNFAEGTFPTLKNVGTVTAE